MTSFSKKVVHKGYKDGLKGKSDKRNDILLLQTTKTMKESKSIAFVELPQSGRVFNGKGFISGFGRLQEDGQHSAQLRTAEIEFISEQTCAATKNEAFEPKLMICGRANDKDACDGDSGGPFVKKEAGKKATLAGIVSFGEQCVNSGTKIGYYVKVSSYLNWIKKHAV